MAEEKPSADRVDQFILEQIETVPHLEALLLAWKKRPKVWSVDEMAGELYVRAEDAGTILRDLSARGLVRESSEQPGHYQYAPSDGHDDLIARLDDTYRRELIRISRMIHAKGPSALRQFASAFRFTKERE